MVKAEKQHEASTGSTVREKPITICPNDVISIAMIMFLMKIDNQVTDMNSYEYVYEREISGALQLTDVYFNHIEIDVFFDNLGKTAEKDLFQKLKKMANITDLQTLTALILTGEVEENMIFAKTSESVSKLAAGLLDIKENEEVADFGYGEKDFVMDIFYQYPQCRYYFYNTEEFFDPTYYFRFALMGIKVRNEIIETFSDLREQKKKFDKVFLGYSSKRVYLWGEEPGFLDDNISHEWNTAWNIMKYLKDDGKVAMIIPSLATTSPKDAEARSKFLDNGYIEAVVALPERMYKRSNAAFSLIVLSKSNRDISFIDASDKGDIIRDGARRMNILSDETVEKIIEKKCSGKNRVSYEEVVQNAGNLNPVAYCTEPIEIKDAVEFGTVITNITRGIQLTSAELDERISTNETGYKYLSQANIENGCISDDVQNISVDFNKQKKYVAEKDNLIISKNMEPFKIALVKEERYLVNGNLYLVEVNQEQINPVYLKAYLESKVGQAELKKASSGSTIKTLGIEALKRILIPKRPMQEQNKIALEYQKLSEEINQKQQEISDLDIKRKVLFD